MAQNTTPFLLMGLAKIKTGFVKHNLLKFNVLKITGFYEKEVLPMDQEIEQQ